MGSFKRNIPRDHSQGLWMNKSPARHIKTWWNGYVNSSVSEKLVKNVDLGKGGVSLTQ